MKHLMFLLLLLTLASCSEHSKIIPSIEKDKAYYNRLEPDLVWKTQVHNIEDAPNGHVRDAKIIDGFIYTLSRKPNKLYCVDLETGEKQWELELPTPPVTFSFYLSDLFKEGNDLYLMDDFGYIYIISQTNGELLETRYLEDDDIDIDTHFPALRNNHYVYYLAYAYPSRSLVRYNLLEHSFETVTNFDRFDQIEYISEGVFDENKDHIFLIISHLDQGTGKKSLISIDLKDKSTRIVWETESNEHFTRKIMSHKDQLFFMPSNTELISVHKESGAISWMATISPANWLRDIFVHLDQLMLFTQYNIFSIDLANGHILAKMDNINPNANTLILPDEYIHACFTWEGSATNLALFDLNDGQKLSRYPLSSDEETSGEYGRFIKYDNTTGSYLIGTNKTIYKLNHLLP